MLPAEVITRERPLIALVGPTATGKTALALALAGRMSDLARFEVISADSRQIYRRLDIATAKPTREQLAALPHHLIDVVDADQPYTLADYQRDATTAILEIQARGAVPLLVGGTGLYVRAVVDGLAIPAVAPDPALRAALEAEAAAHGVDALYQRLLELDPVAGARIDRANPRRLVRALEVCLLTGRPFSEQQRTNPPGYRLLMVGLNMERQALYARADQRIDAMLESGLLDEAQTLVRSGYAWALPAMSSLGYRELGAYLRGEMSLSDAVARFKLDTHAYIRRQLSWFRADTRIKWLNAGLPQDELAREAAAMVRGWLTDLG